MTPSVWALAFLLLRAAQPAAAQPAAALASDRLLIEGTRLSIAPGDEAQILDVAESARVRTCYAGACGSMPSSDPRVAGLLVKAELSGPELQAPATYAATPGGAFLLPGVQTEGTYVLSNVRLVRAAVPGGPAEEILGQAMPSVAVLQVRRILATSATVRQLTLAELQARGIQITQQNYEAYSFAVGFAFEGGLVKIDFPVLFQEGGRVDLLSKPDVNLDGLPKELAASVRRWQPPRIVPFRLGAGGAPGVVTTEEMEALPPETRLFGVIVLPGNVSFLHKYFDAQLLVANGAPAGSGAVLANVTSTVRLPAAVPRELLRLAGTTPSVAPGQAVPVLGAGGETHLGPGEQGTATFTLEGVAPGTHVVTMEVGADLERPGRDVLPLTGKLRAAIEVVDARFNLAFNHPDVVRNDEAYTLFVTVTNVSTRNWENAITLALEAGSATGAVKADPSDSFQRRIETLGPGEGATVEFRLVAKVTGRCVATAFQSTGSVQGVIQLRAGVGEHGIPLSPSSLVLPRFTEQLPEPLVAANVPLLGLAYSLAVAPPGAIPADLPRLVQSDVERRAVDLAEAGQRLFLGDERLPSLEALLLDQLGNRHDLPEFDQLRRTIEKGRSSAEGLASFLRQEQESKGYSASALLEHVAGTMSYARPYVAATLESAGSGIAPTLEVRKLDGVTGVTYLAYSAGDARALRSLAFGETYDILDRPGGARAPLAVVGRISGEAGYSIVVHGPITGAAMPVILAFVAPAPSGGGFVRVAFPPIAVPPGEAWAVDVVRAEGDDRPLTYSLCHLATGVPVVGAPVPAAPVAVVRPPFRIVGARQDFVLDPYGSGVWYLFNRPPAKADAETAGLYEVQTRFQGLDTTSSGVTLERTTTFQAVSALLQPSSERVVAVRFAQPVSAIVATHGGNPVVSNDHRLDLANLRDGWGEALTGPVPAIGIEPDHVGGLVEGKVLRGTGEAVAGAVVRLIRDRVVLTDGGADAKVLHDLVAERSTDDSGGFFFPFIEEPIRDVPRPAEKGAVQSGFRIQAVAPAGLDPLAPEEREEVASIIRLQSRLARVSIALLGRGTVTGRILYEDSSPVPAATVTAASTLFSEVRSTVGGADGTFRLEAMPVGPITVTARDAAGRSSHATVGLAAPGATVDVTLRLQRAEAPRTGAVSGRVSVRRGTAEGPATEPASGATVAVYSGGAPFGVATIGDTGAFFFAGVPAGRVTVQAADFSVSRTPALAVTDLAADTTVNVVLTLAASSPRSVSGQVRYRDPLTQVDGPVGGATVFVEGPGNYALTDEQGVYEIDGVPALGIDEPPYVVHAIDFARKLEGTTVVSITEASSDPVIAATIQVRGSAVGAIDGVVLDPLGQPAAGVTVTVLPIGETTSGADGTFSIEGVPARPYTVAAHKGDGLQPSAIGWIGEAPTQVLFGGHRAFATVRLRGAGTVHVRTRTANGPVRAPVSYRPTWFSPQELTIRQKATAIETTTDDNGSLTLVVPVGGLSIGAASPFYGTGSFEGAIDFAGQVKEVDLVFQPLATVTGTVVDVDGVTPVAGVTIELRAPGLPPQANQTGGNGEFEFALVPTGRLTLTANGLVGTIERTGRTYATVTEPGQSLEVVVRLKAKGTVRAGVVEETAPGVRSPVAGAQVALRESDFPYRRLPAAPGFLTADANGRFEVADVTAGRFTVVARDPGQVTRQGSLSGELSADFEVVEAGDVVLSGQVGNLTVLVRDPQTGSPVPDTQVTLSNGEATVAGADGRAEFVALPLGTWSVHAFHAPTGSGGRLAGIHLDTAGQSLEVVVVLDQKGRVSGTLFDDAARTTPIGGGTVRLEGTVNGRLWGARVTALATTSREDGSLGRFTFDGLPVASYSLTAAVEGSDRRAEGAATLTPTAPEQGVELILDAVREVYVRIFQKEQSRGLVEVNPDPAQGDGVFAVSYGRHWNVYTGEPIPIASRLLPDRPSPNHHYRFADVLAAKAFWIRAEESGGEGRRALVRSAVLADGSFGAGTEPDPYRIVLKARGTVRATVRDAGGGAAAGATVRLHAANGSWESATDSAGRTAFTAVEEGTVSVSASIPGSPFGASASRVLEWDDQILDVDLTLSPVVSAHGVVYEAPEDDSWGGDPSTLRPAEGVAVRIQPSAGDAQLLITGADGGFRFSGLAPGVYGIVAQSLDGARIVHTSGTLGSVHGTDYGLPPLILDASRPRILTLSPPNGTASVSRTAPVEILFSEPLLAAVLPSGPASPFFHLTFGETPAAGTWSSSVDAEGRQVVRFTPTPRYENSTTYSLRIEGGPSGVRDREGRPLTDSGDIGASFTTSDTDGPRVVGTVPSFARPVDPQTPIRIDFGEVLVLSSAQLQAAVLFEWKNAAGSWAVHPVTVSLTRGGYSILVDQPLGVTFTDDSLRRRVSVSGLTDAAGNPMPAWFGEYRTYDLNAPILSIGLPPNAPTGDLSASASYTLSPAFTEPDDVTPENPFGDVDRVEYSFASAADPTQPASSPGAVVTAAPFAFAFVASYTGDGATPRPFPVWVKAFDTSGNPSTQVRLDMRVLPNTPPVVSGVTVSATAPVAGKTYAGSTLSAAAAELSDGDDARLTISAELRRGTAASSELVVSAPARSVDRPADGWGALPVQTFTFTLPITEVEEAALLVRVRAVDSKGVAGTADAAFTVADDAVDPVVTDLVARRPNGDAATSFVIGETFVLEATARDAETGVRSLIVTTAGVVLPPTLAATRVGTSDLFRTVPVTAPASLTEPVRVGVTATAEDYGGNDGAAPLTLDLAPSSDPTKPAIEWLSPFEGGLWPAGYASVDPGKTGIDLLLRFRVTDKDVDGGGNEVPGSVVSARFRGPIDASGTLAAEWSDACRLVQGTGEWVYEGVWRVPNGVVAGTVLRFEAEAVDAGANRTPRSVLLQAVPARHVYEAATTSVGSGSEIPAAAGSEALPVFLLDGTTLSLYPPFAGGPRSYASLHLYSGGAQPAGAGSAVTVRRTTLTAPEVTSYQSSVPYYPLDLSIGETLAIGHGAAIDVTGRGLLGGDASHAPVVLPGERASLAGAGGSHGGMGRPPYGEWLPHLGDAGSAYGNVREPRLPGGGGGNRGGTGGGVLRIEAPSATARLFGDLVADGGPVPAGGNVGAAGGSVRLRAGRLEGRGELRANGSWPRIDSPGGSGGRVALSWAEPPVPGVTARAEGGSDPQAGPAGTGDVPLAGAGTVFRERLDAAGIPLDRGTLRVSNPASTDAPAWTPLPGLGAAAVTSADVAGRVLTVSAPSATGSIEGERLVVTIPAPGGGSPTTLVLPVASQTRTAGTAGSGDQAFRLVVVASEPEVSQVAAAISGGAAVTVRARLSYAAFEGRGSARIVSSDELEVAGVVDQRSALALDPSARILLGGEAPAVSFEGTSPTPGSNVGQGGAIDVRFRATDPLGLSVVETTWSVAGTTSTRPLSEPLEVLAVPNPTHLAVPTTQPTGPVTYRVRAIDRAGRATESTVSWNVVGDAVKPVITAIELSPSKPGDTYVAGDTVTIRVLATDDVKLERISVTLDGRTVESPTSPATFTWLARPVPASSSFLLSVIATDQTGNFDKVEKTITVTPRVDAVPPTIAIDCPSSGAILPSGYASFVLQATASDDQGVQRVEVYREGEATPIATSYATTGSARSYAVTTQTIALPTVAESTPIRFRVRAVDFGGNVSAEVQTEIAVVPAVPISATGANDWPALAGQTAYLESGTLVLDQPRTLGGLLILRGATVTQIAGGDKSVDLEVSGPLFVECGGSIDVTGRGYPAGATYSGNVESTNAAGSHLGVGGVYPNAAKALTYGSVERPREAGSGSWGGNGRSGGGVIRIEAGSVVLGGPTASILANGGAGGYADGAGGSIWITAGTLTGNGLIEAAGGNTFYRRGGGGAVTVEYGASSGTALTRVNARGGGTGSSAENGGAGTVCLKGPGATYGTLRVDNGATSGQATVLPSLGSGTAQEGTSGAVLATGRTSIPAYFTGHWVEVRRAGSTLGTWRIGTIAGGTVTLETNGSEAVSLLVGDSWQGVYQFDRVDVAGNAVLQSVDPIRTPTMELTGPTTGNSYTELPGPVAADTVVVNGNVLTPGITATTLTVKTGARLTSPASTATETKSLSLVVGGVLTIEDGGSIDVTGRGYPAGATYSGNVESTNAAGSHLGVGGVYPNAAKALTYGSVERPREAGSGSWGGNGRSGGGVIRIEAGSVVLGGPTASILANGGAGGYADGAGGSIWITAGTLTGNGLIEAAGGNTFYRRGGGGAVTVEYGASSGTALTRVNARGGGTGSSAENGGAGTVCLKGPGATYGTLRVDNGATSGQATVLPSLGSGTAQEGTSGAVLATGRTSIPAYFTGHWVEVRRAGSTLGTWRIGTIAGGTVTLETNGSEAVSLLVGDSWQGVYQFDRVDVLGNARLESQDTVYDGPPSITVSSPAPNATFASGASVPVTFQTADDRGVARVILSLGGIPVEISGPAPTSGVVKAPWVGTTSTASLEATVVDIVGQSTSKTVPLTILAAPALTASVTYPWDGAMLWAGTSQRVVVELPDARPIRRVTVALGTFSMAFDDLVGPTLEVSIPLPSLTADESRLLTVVVEDGLEAPVTSPPIPVTLLVDDGPRVSAWTSASSPVAPGSEVYVGFDATFRSDEGARLRLQVTGAVEYDKTYSVGEFGSSVGGRGVSSLDIASNLSRTLPPFIVPSEARGLMTIQVTAIDGSNRMKNAQPITLDVDRLLSLSVAGASVVAPGGTLELELSAASAAQSETVEIDVWGGFDWGRTVHLGYWNDEAGTTVRTLRIPVPASAIGEAWARLRVPYPGPGEGSDLWSNTVTFTVADGVSPLVSRLRSTHWGYVSGTEVSFLADVADEGDLQEVRFLVDGVPVPGAPEPIETASWRSAPHTLPIVSAPTSVTLRVEALDLAGNVGSAERTLVVLPAGTPLVRLVLPTSGAMTVAGGVVPIRAEVSHPRPITQVAFYRGGEPTPISIGTETVASYDVPAGTTAGSEMTFRVRVTDDLGAVGEAMTLVRVVDGDVLSDGSTIAVGDLSHEDRPIVVQGRVSVAGTHRFSRLLVLPGAALAHEPTEGASVRGLDVQVTGDVYISSYGSVDAVGLGFEGGLQGGNATTAGLTVGGETGSTDGAGGSHGGWGRGASAGGTYGSVLSPTLPGAGGSASAAGGAGGPGGGVIHLVVGGRLIVDGEMNASGVLGNGGAGGAGGSIRVEASSIGGSGAVLANGGDPGGLVGRGGSAGGGRISIVGSREDVSPVIRAASGEGWYASGGAGTVYLRAPEDRKGHLVIDSGACEQVDGTSLGSVETASLSGVGEGRRSFRLKAPVPWTLAVGQPVEIWHGSAFVGRFLVESVESLGPNLTNVTLDASAEFLLSPGDTLVVAHLFDSVDVRGRANLSVECEVEGVAFVDPAAWFITRSLWFQPMDSAPRIEASAASDSVPPWSLQISVSAQDDQSLTRYVLWIEGADGSQLEVPIAGGPTQDERTVTYTVPAALPLGTHLLGVGVFDGAGQRTATAFRITVATGSGFVSTASATPPAALPSPRDRDRFHGMPRRDPGAARTRAGAPRPRSHD